MNLEVVLGNIVYADVDAIVNPSNKALLAGDGVRGAIFKEAGLQDLQNECNKIGHCDVGQAVITKGYNLKAKYIIHTVGPHYFLSKNPAKELKSAYLNCLKLADKYNLKTIAFPCISTGIYAYPLKEASEIAIEAIKEYKPKSLVKVIFYTYSSQQYDLYISKLNNSVVKKW